jgi:hypothetical protein
MFVIKKKNIRQKTFLQDNCGILEMSRSIQKYSLILKLWGPGKTTYPLSANANILSATPRFLLSAFCSNYDVNIPLSAPIMMLKCGSYVSVVPAGREWWKVCWHYRKVDTLIYPDPKLCSQRHELL